MNSKLGNVPVMGGSQRVRDLILVILSEEFPLTIKELYNRVTTQGHDVTYQAVHKVVKQLMHDNIVEKKEKGVQLSKNWIHHIKDYAYTVDAIYTKGKQHRLPTTFNRQHTLVFDNYSTFVVWIAENFRDGNFTQGKTGPIYGIFHHAPWPLRFNFMDFELLRQMSANCPTRGFCVCDMPFDRWIATHYKLGGVQSFRTGVKIKIEDDYYVTGDSVIRVKYSPETKKFLDKIYAKINDLKDLFHFYFTEVDKNDLTHIEVTIERNPTMAKIIENQVITVLKKI